MSRSFHLVLAALAALLATPVAEAAPLYNCTGSAYTAYYVLWGRNLAPGPYEVDTHSSTTGGNHEIDELHMEDPIIVLVCAAEEEQWLAQQGLYVWAFEALGGAEDGELFAVFDPSTWQEVGTVWRDLYEPLDQGGAMGYQKYWSRTTDRWYFNPYLRKLVWVPPSGPVVQDVAMFSSGLDRSAVNGTTETDKDTYYFGRISTMLHVALDQHISQNENYPYQYTKQGFLSAFGNAANTYLHYDLVDPIGGSGIMNP